MSKKKMPSLLRLLYFLPLVTGPYDLTIASVVSIFGYMIFFLIACLGQKILTVFLNNLLSMPASTPTHKTAYFQYVDFVQYVEDAELAVYTE